MDGQTKNRRDKEPLARIFILLSIPLFIALILLSMLCAVPLFVPFIFFLSIICVQCAHENKECKTKSVAAPIFPVEILKCTGTLARSNDEYSILRFNNRLIIFVCIPFPLRTKICRRPMTQIATFDYQTFSSTCVRTTPFA